MIADWTGLQLTVINLPLYLWGQTWQLEFFSTAVPLAKVSLLLAVFVAAITTTQAMTDDDFKERPEATETAKTEPGQIEKKTMDIEKTKKRIGFIHKEGALKPKTKQSILDTEGRFLQLEFEEFFLINLYFPNAQRELKRLTYKEDFNQTLLKYTENLKKKKPVILCGDFNVAHQEIDLARPKQNQNNTMFTPEERKQIDKLVSLGFADTFRKFHKKGGCYTWWPYWRKARERNLGWRIDYAFTSKRLTPKVKKAFILSKVKGSDHCPIAIEL